MSAMNPAVGMICELNPFHNGHAYLLRRMRAAAGEEGCAVCLMSGRFVQRGAPVVADPYLRARCALAGGANLVLELPFPWSAASAEPFAAAGVDLLARLGVGTLFFGSECGDAALLRRAAEAVGSRAFADRFASLCRAGGGTAGAYVRALREALAPGEPDGAPLPGGFPSSNDLLCVAYLRAIRRNPEASARLSPRVVRRQGQRDTESFLTDAAFPSASALRLLLREAAGDPVCLDAVLSGSMPDEARRLLTDAAGRGEAPLSEAPLLAFYRLLFRVGDPASFGTRAGMGGGLAGHICRAARESSSDAGFFPSLRTRQFTDARLRRAMLFAATGVSEEDLSSSPAYTTVLAADRIGRRFLRELRARKADRPSGSPPLAVVTKPADAPDGRQALLGARADALFTVCFPVQRAAGSMRTRTPYMAD